MPVASSDCLGYHVANHKLRAVMCTTASPATTAPIAHARPRAVSFGASAAYDPTPAIHTTGKLCALHATAASAAATASLRPPPRHATAIAQKHSPRLR